VTVYSHADAAQQLLARPPTFTTASCGSTAPRTTGSAAATSSATTLPTTSPPASAGTAASWTDQGASHSSSEPVDDRCEHDAASMDDGVPVEAAGQSAPVLHAVEDRSTTLRCL
jgi:hypothetical protein